MTTLLSLVLIAWQVSAAPAGARGPAESADFDIPSGDASATLTQYSMVSGLQVLFIFEVVTGRTTHAVSGNMTPAEALDVMIEGTGLRAEFIDYRIVALSVPELATAGATGPGKSRHSHRSEGNPPPLPEAHAANSAMQEVEIFGTNLFPVASPVLNVTRDEIDATPTATVSGIVRTLPQIFGGGPSEDTRLGTEAQSNTGRGMGINLRGLGAGSTLVLLNGQRLAGSGSEGLFTDISNLPSVAIQSVEILPESSSTLYGADAVGGMVNFVLRDSFVGRQTEARVGSSTRGAPRERYLSQLVGGETGSGHGLLAVEYYSRDSLPASSRTQMNSDLRPFGGDNFDLVQSNPGTLIIGTQTWALPTGQDGSHLDPASLMAGSRNYQNASEGADALPMQQHVSLFGSWRSALSANINLFTNALVTERKVQGAGAAASGNIQVTRTNPFYVNPTGGNQPVTVGYNFIDDLGPVVGDGTVRTQYFSAGLNVDSFAPWHITSVIDYGYERERLRFGNLLDRTALDIALADPDPATAFNPFGDGTHTNPSTLAKLRTEGFFGTRSDVAALKVAATRPLLRLPGGAVTLTLGAEGRKLSLHTEARSQPQQPSVTSRLDRAVNSGFAEARIPLWGPDNRRRGLESLELSLAGRYESYSDFGHATSPRIALRWAPTQTLGLRGTWSQSLRPPSLPDLNEANNATTLTALADPNIPGGRAAVLVWTGKNADLTEETARSWTAGLDMEPLWAQGLSLALTYFDIDFTNRVNTPAFAPDLLTNARYSSLVTRSPTAAQREEVCRRAPLSAQPGACLASPIDALIDLRLRDEAAVRTRGIDLVAHYKRETSFGRLTLGLNSTYVLDFEEAATRGVPLVDRVSTQNYPVDFRLRGSFGWQHAGLNVNTYLNYTDGYRDEVSVPHRRVSSWSTFDLNAAYGFEPNAHGWLGKTTLALGVENLFDKDPPFLNNALGLGYDQENADITGRFVSFTLRQNW
ncbi:MAG: TonB-dependent receptor [Gammaproteobacteria bacterium]